MKKLIKSGHEVETANDQPGMTVGLDLGDRYSHYCLLNEDSEVVEEGRIQSTEASLRRHFEGEPRLRIALEAGTHSPWVSRLLKALGHQVIVANPRKLPAITASQSKNDRNDAELLARFAAHDPRLLSPVRHRSLERQQDLNLIQVRSTLVRARTMLVNALRGLVKSAGGRAVPPSLCPPAPQLRSPRRCLSRPRLCWSRSAC
jgi:transposase